MLPSESTEVHVRPHSIDAHRAHGVQIRTGPLQCMKVANGSYLWIRRHVEAVGPWRSLPCHHVGTGHARPQRALQPVVHAVVDPGIHAVAHVGERLTHSHGLRRDVHVL